MNSVLLKPDFFQFTLKLKHLIIPMYRLITCYFIAIPLLLSLWEKTWDVEVEKQWMTASQRGGTEQD